MDWDSFKCACGELDDRAGPQTAGEAPRRHAASDFSDYVPAVDEDEIDGKLHSECMYSLTGYDPQAFTFWEGLSAEQAPCAGTPAIGYFHTCDESLCPQIANLPPWGRVSSLVPSIARQVRFPEPARDIHSQWRYEPCATRRKTILRDAGILAVWPFFKKSHTGQPLGANTYTEDIYCGADAAPAADP